MDINILPNITGEQQDKVRRSNHLINAEGKKLLSPIAQKLLLYCFTKINKENPSEEISFGIREFFQVDRLFTSHYKNADTACQNLVESAFKIRSGDYGKEFKAIYTPLYSHIIIEGGTIRFAFNPKFIEMVAPTKNFTDFLYQNILNMRSTFSMRLYELLKQGVDRYPTREFDLDELKKILSISNKATYSRFSTFRTKVLDTGCREINEHSDLNVSWEVAAKSGRAIKRIRFYMEYKSGDEKSMTAKPKAQQQLDFETTTPKKETPVEKPSAKTSVTTKGMSLNNLDEKQERLLIRLQEFDLSKSMIEKAVIHYIKNPDWSIWKEIKRVKIAVQDGVIKNAKQVMNNYLKEHI